MYNYFNHSRTTLSCLVATLLFLLGTGLQAQNEGSNHGNKFEQLGEILPDPNIYRGPDGAPGPEYWQQRADYDIECSLDVENLKLDGKELITYYNQSPSTLRYLWLQLDENEHSDLTDQHHADPNSLRNTMSEQQLKMLESIDRSKYGHKIEGITTATGQPLKYIINQTMLRIDLPEPLKPGEQFSFYVDWYYYITDRMNPFFRGRGGYEYFEKEDNYIFTITQWYPRLCVYSDVEGWQNKQFTGRGEFALTFGNFIVKMTVPEDHVIGSTGECLNYSTVLTPDQLKRWEQAKTATEPIEIVTLEEAKKTEKAKKATNTKTWIYKADNVRDFAWTASRKFVWDALPHFTEDGRRVMCMSYYGKEAYPIYNRYSTKTVAHTLKTYSKYTIPYPYPVAISVEASNGMEYPMICFNYGRAEEDGTYTERAKYGAIGVIIHEVGHNYFPMIINSDERQWTWMDEGINTFLQFLTEQEFDNNYPSRRGPAYAITDYMKAGKDLLEPIMTNSENIVQFGPNAYAKPATALNILRETVMGRELFDYAFKEYSRRWAFKHPTPADFFRTMEDASAVDLDWFWRGWFYTTEAVDISLDSIQWFKVDMENDPEPREVSYPIKREQPYDHLSKRRNREEGKEFAVEKDPELVDFYSNYKPWETKDSVTTAKTELYAETLTKKEKEDEFGDKNYYELFFSNKGGLVMPVILEFTFEDGTTEVEKLPAQIWRKNEDKFSRVFVKDKVVTGIKLDPFRETADIDESNNSWPVQEMPSRFQIFKSHKSEERPNPMQEAKAAGKVIRP
ncbi:MAG: M1 family metallopeptidase [Lewinella sp.]|nr:M1 family metallopeptidase [Lewinella sp.]